MKTRMLTALLLLTLILSGCASGEASPNAGLWTAHSVSVWGAQQPAREVFAGGFTIDLMSGGRAVITMDHVSADAVWTLKDGLFTISGGGLEASGTLEGDQIVLQEILGTGTTVSFYRAGTEVPKIIVPQDPQRAPQGSGPSIGLGPQTPAEPTESADPVETVAYLRAFSVPSFWQGTIGNYNIEGDFRFPQMFDVEGVLQIDGPSGLHYFEIWSNDGQETQTILSMYVDLYPDHFIPKIEEGDAWLYYHDLAPHESVFFEGRLVNGEMIFIYPYREPDGTKADVEIIMRPEATY